MAAVLVSACLLGLKTRYDGTDARDEGLVEMLGQEGVTPVPVCPEQLGGLPTPRPPCVIEGGDGGDVLDKRARVARRDGADLTESFIRGAEQTLLAARAVEASRAFMKEKSPSCGVRTIHVPGGELACGPGVASALLMRNGIEVEGR